MNFSLFKKSSLFIIIFSLIAFLLLSACITQAPSQAYTGDTVRVQITIEGSNGLVLWGPNSFAVPAGANLWDLMKREVRELEFQEYSFGVMVTGLQGVPSSESEYWALYLNGAYSDKGVSDVVLNQDTIVLWKLESMNAAPVNQ